MRLLVEVMRKTTAWGCAWWTIRHYENALRAAESLGLVVRASTSQVHWTDKGIALYLKYCEEV